MAYRRSDYGSNPHAGANRNNAAQRGWGSGWRDCQKSRQVKVAAAGVVVYVRREIADLVATLMTKTERRYNYKILPGQTWGYACRPIRGTTTASNHSWGLAVDINSESNPMQPAFKSDIPPAVVKMWEACGFYWGGRYVTTPDTMHFEYIFRPADVAKHVARARRYGSAAPGVEYEPYTTGAAAGSRTIRQGSAGSDVKELQRTLNAWYPSLQRLAVDGYFGLATTKRVRYLQERAGIEVDGVVGPVTWRKLLRT